MGILKRLQKKHNERTKRARILIRFCHKKGVASVTEEEIQTQLAELQKMEKDKLLHLFLDDEELELMAMAKKAMEG